ncbi:MAG TPA: ATP-binding protein [Candidatus Methylomirabilis sp.]|nr:ATP-binding protein [Candidatus Methylomirabilis sp.]HSC69765.1 ATP-binding protein [Candidatus Methylomirabilis sp.]
MRLTIGAKSVLAISLLIAFSLALVGLYLERRERSSVVAQSVARLEAQASVLAVEVGTGLAEGDTWAQRVKARTGARVTLIASDGRVLADSDESSNRMENHAHRPEVAAALAAGSGHAMRFSATVGRDLLYFAQALPRSGGERLILRLSIPVGQVAQGFTRFRRDFLAIAVISLVVASGIAILWTHGISRQLRQMVRFAQGVSRREMTTRLPIASRDEIGELAEALNAMAASLKETLHRLEDEGQRIRTIMQSMAEGLLVIDARGRISLVNPAAEALLGVREARALGQTPLEMVRSHELDDLLKAAGERGDAAAAEITLIHPRRRILAGTAAAIRGADGAVEGTVLALRDITQLKRLEEMRMEFVLNVSHELRTPLTAIRGYAETLLDGDLKAPEEARKFLEVIHRHSERLARLLDDLLDLSNIELERVPLHIRPLTLPEVARQATAMVMPQVGQKSIRMESAIPLDLPPVLADRDRLVQVLVNLLDNAVKYTPSGGSVTLRAAVLPAEGDRGGLGQSRVEIVVEDTGIGVPKKDLPRITERFYRVDKARSREMGGTGLGLAIVKHLVEAHAGTLAIESEPGKGTLVRVILPVAPA